MRIFKIATIVAFFFLALVPFAARRASVLPAAQASEKAAVATANLEDFIGSDSCSECHTNQAAHYKMTAHRKTIHAGAAADKQGCEACHGGAKKHVDFYLTAKNLIKAGQDAEAQALYADEAKGKEAKMRSFKDLSPAQSTALCLQCHEGAQGKSEERFNYRRSEHARHGVACVDCHSSHSPKQAEFLLRENEPEGCYKCHADQKASFAKPFHHKVPEGGMKCSDCHNQHGSFQQKQLRGWVGGEVGCVKCHADKAGPFVYEHAPVKVEGCQACHTPHGSTNPRMLKRNEVRLLCLECHSNTPGIPEEGSGLGPPTPSFHNLSAARFQNCTVCHVAIHGSNTHPAFYKP
ncbi:MAG: DmsE family decaheme c-type cytochrome [Acidobacteria bacterium]|nr:DmsE family decaheme c-type cytochrome [Acidobacteriota bacterium]